MKNWIKYLEEAAKDLEKQLEELKDIRRVGDKPKKLNVVCKCK